jgi:hypothetical protein
MTQELPPVATAAGIAYITGDRVLLLKRAANAASNPSTWGFPAGGIEEGESGEQAAVRESVEETGHAPSAITLLEERGGFVLFLCVGDTFAPTLNEEHDGYVWATTSDLPSPLHPAVADQITGAFQAVAAINLALTDAVSMDESARTVDTNGWPEISRNPLSKVGVFPYLGRQVGDAENPDRQYRVYRPAEELADPECIDSFRLLPWIDDHVMLGSEEDGLMPAERKGIQGVIGEDVFFEDGTLYGNLKVFSQSMAGLIEAGKRELSCGYRCVYDFTKGVFQGAAYDAIQRTIRGNHLALVHSGRMGPDVAVLDSIDQSTSLPKEPPMADKENEGGSGMTLDAALATLKQAMPAIKMIMDEAEKSDEKKDDKDDEKKAEDADFEKKDDDKKDDKKEEAKAADSDKNPDMSMDAALTFKELVGQIARRDTLAKQLSAHIGTFDHSEMNEAEVASYGVKQLGIKAQAGQEAAVLSGYLLAKGDPAKAATAKTAAAMDTGTGSNFVTRHLNKGA